MLRYVSVAPECVTGRIDVIEHVGRILIQQLVYQGPFMRRSLGKEFGAAEAARLA